MLSALVHKTSKAKTKSFELISLAEEIFKMSSIDYVTWLLVITYSDLQYICVSWTKRTKKHTVKKTGA